MAITTPETDPLQSGIVNNQLGTEPAPEPAPAPTEAPAPDATAAPAAAPEPYKAPTTAPVTTEVAPEGETVESRLGALTEKGSRYTELARKDAIREANTRGLINTTMAGAAGTEAAIRAALPIAQQDAQTQTETRIRNQTAENEFLRNRQSADLNKELNTLQNSFKQEGMKLDVELKTDMEKIMQNQKLSDQVKLDSFKAVNEIVRDTAVQIAEIGMTDRSAEQQAGAIKALQDNRDAQIAVHQELLGGFEDWVWSTDLTAERSEPAPA